MMRWIWLVLLLWCGPAWAAQLDLSAFGRVPIQHEGRIKPIESVAILHYKALQDSAMVDNGKAVSFLAQCLFDPANAADMPVIAVRNPRTRALLGLNNTDKYVSLSALIEPLLKHDKEMTAWLQMNPDELSEDQADMLRLYDVTVGMTQILRTFTAILPLSVQLPDDLARQYDLPVHDLVYLDFIDAEERLNADLKKLLKFKGDNLKAYSEEEQILAYLAYQLQEIRMAGAGNGLMRLIPTGWNATWSSPWDMLLLGTGSPEAMKTLTVWQEISDAYRADDKDAFDKAVAALTNRVAYEEAVTPWRLYLEQIYVNMHPITSSLGLYAAALVLWLIGRNFAGVLFLSAAIFVHAASIVMRIMILDRPPVGTLFESILFVGFIAVLGAFLFARKLPQHLGILLAGLLGLGLQLTTLGFVQNGDTLQTLEAVLNTPFWLATHVLVISAGYGFCLLLAMIAHTDLWQRARRIDTKPLVSLMQGIGVAALLLTTVGTILGGLWADQSWGRFWGWDPKENGALLIVLWLTWIMHGKISGHIKPVAYSAGCAFVSVIVALAWFGVNLLSTGLHSYGFISGVAGGLAAYVLVQSLVIAGLWWRAHRTTRT